MRMAIKQKLPLKAGVLQLLSLVPLRRWLLQTEDVLNFCSLGKVEYFFKPEPYDPWLKVCNCRIHPHNLPVLWSKD